MIPYVDDKFWSYCVVTVPNDRQCQINQRSFGRCQSMTYLRPVLTFTLVSNAHSVKVLYLTQFDIEGAVEVELEV